MNSTYNELLYSNNSTRNFLVVKLFFIFLAKIVQNTAGKDRFWVVHSWTDTVQPLPRDFTSDSVVAVTRIKRRIMIYPEPSNVDDPGYYLAIDYQNQETCEDIVVPVYPESGDAVEVKDTW